MNVELPPISATTTNGVRLYETPEGNKYPSITTILSVRNKSGLVEWRKRVGEKTANYIAGKAAARGTKVHHMCEDYLNNVSFIEPDWWQEKQKNFLPFCLFMFWDLFVSMVRCRLLKHNVAGLKALVAVPPTTVAVRSCMSWKEFSPQPCV